MIENQGDSQVPFITLCLATRNLYMSRNCDGFFCFSAFLIFPSRFTPRSFSRLLDRAIVAAKHLADLRPTLDSRLQYFQSLSP